jgi:hypothetical protein
MSDFFDHVAGAALPVAVGLLVLAGVARAVLWAQLEGEERRLAQQYLEPLATWCLMATGTYAFAICADGDAAVLPLGAAMVTGGAAMLLRRDETETAAVTGDEPKPDVRRSPVPEALGTETGGRRAFQEPVPTHGRTPEPTAPSLWDDANEAPRTGLWAR